MRVAIYARVSTTDKDQDPGLQLGPLREYAHARDCLEKVRVLRQELENERWR